VSPALSTSVAVEPTVSASVPGSAVIPSSIAMIVPGTRSAKEPSTNSILVTDDSASKSAVLSADASPSMVTDSRRNGTTVSTPSMAVRSSTSPSSIVPPSLSMM
jgi:hypothetical protein